MEAVAAYICSKSGVKAITAAFDHAVAAGHFTSPHDALQRLFEWGATRNHVKLLRKLDLMCNALSSPSPVAVDPAVGSPREVWAILLPHSLARRRVAEQLELLQEAMIKCVLVDDADVLRFVLGKWNDRFPPAKRSPFGSDVEQLLEQDGQSALHSMHELVMQLCQLAIQCNTHRCLTAVLRDARCLQLLQSASSAEKRNLLLSAVRSGGAQCCPLILQVIPDVGLDSELGARSLSTALSTAGDNDAVDMHVRAMLAPVPVALAHPDLQHEHAPPEQADINGAGSAGAESEDSSDDDSAHEWYAPGGADSRLALARTALRVLARFEATRFAFARDLRCFYAPSQTPSPSDMPTRAERAHGTASSLDNAAGELSDCSQMGNTAAMGDLRAESTIHAISGHLSAIFPPAPAEQSASPHAAPADSTSTPAAAADSTTTPSTNANSMLSSSIFDGLLDTTHGRVLVACAACRAEQWQHIARVVRSMAQEIKPVLPGQYASAKENMTEVFAEVTSYCNLARCLNSSAEGQRERASADDEAALRFPHSWARQLPCSLVWALQLCESDLYTYHGVWCAVSLCLALRDPASHLDALLDLCIWKPAFHTLRATLDAVLYCSIQTHHQDAFEWWRVRTQQHMGVAHVPADLLQDALRAAHAQPPRRHALAFVIEAVRRGHARLGVAIGEASALATWTSLLQQAARADAAASAAMAAKLQTFPYTFAVKSAQAKLYVQGGCMAQLTALMYSKQAVQLLSLEEVRCDRTLGTLGRRTGGQLHEPGAAFTAAAVAMVVQHTAFREHVARTLQQAQAITVRIGGPVPAALLRQVVSRGTPEEEHLYSHLPRRYELGFSFWDVVKSSPPSSVPIEARLLQSIAALAQSLVQSLLPTQQAAPTTQVNVSHNHTLRALEAAAQRRGPLLFRTLRRLQRRVIEHPAARDEWPGVLSAAQLVAADKLRGSTHLTTSQIASVISHAGTEAVLNDEYQVCCTLLARWYAQHSTAPEAEVVAQLLMRGPHRGVSYPGVTCAADALMLRLCCSHSHLRLLLPEVLRTPPDRALRWFRRRRTETTPGLPIAGRLWRNSQGELHLTGREWCPVSTLAAGMALPSQELDVLVQSLRGLQELDVCFQKALFTQRLNTDVYLVLKSLHRLRDSRLERAVLEILQWHLQRTVPSISNTHILSMLRADLCRGVLHSIRAGRLQCAQRMERWGQIVLGGFLFAEEISILDTFNRVWVQPEQGSRVGFATGAAVAMRQMTVLSVQQMEKWPAERQALVAAARCLVSSHCAPMNAAFVRQGAPCIVAALRDALRAPWWRLAISSIAGSPHCAGKELNILMLAWLVHSPAVAHTVPAGRAALAASELLAHLDPSAEHAHHANLHERLIQQVKQMAFGHTAASRMVRAWVQLALATRNTAAAGALAQASCAAHLWPKSKRCKRHMGLQVEKTGSAPRPSDAGSRFVHLLRTEFNLRRYSASYSPRSRVVLRRASAQRRE